MQLRVNGVVREVPADTTVAVLLDDLRVPQAGIAVAVNQTVVPRPEQADQRLQPQDQVEIIHAVGGG